MPIQPDDAHPDGPCEWTRVIGARSLAGRFVLQSLPQRWLHVMAISRSQSGEDPPNTDMNSQPWVSCANPLGHLWVSCLHRAIADGFIPHVRLEQAVAGGHVRPSLLAQIDAGIDDPLALPAWMRALDRGFVAPYKQMNTGSARPWTTPTAAVRAWLRRLYFRSPFVRRTGRQDSA